MSTPEIVEAKKKLAALRAALADGTVKKKMDAFFQSEDKEKLNAALRQVIPRFSQG